MLMHDYFMAQAVKGIISAVCAPGRKMLRELNATDIADIAEAASRMADAMLEVRKDV